MVRRGKPLRLFPTRSRAIDRVKYKPVEHVTTFSQLQRHGSGLEPARNVVYPLVTAIRQPPQIFTAYQRQQLRLETECQLRIADGGLLVVDVKVICPLLSDLYSH